MGRKDLLFYTIIIWDHQWTCSDWCQVSNPANYIQGWHLTGCFISPTYWFLICKHDVIVSLIIIENAYKWNGFLCINIVIFHFCCLSLLFLEIYMVKSHHERILSVLSSENNDCLMFSSSCDAVNIKFLTYCCVQTVYYYSE